MLLGPKLKDDRIHELIRISSMHRCVNLCVCLSLSIFYVAELAECCLFVDNLYRKSKKINNDQELKQSDPISYPQNQKGNN